MPKAPLTRDDLEGFLRDLEVRLQRTERHTHNFSPPAPPGPAPAPPYVAPPVDDCVPWTDDFERGSLGPDWVLGPADEWADDLSLFSISSGAAVATKDSNMTGLHEASSMRRSVQESTGNHFIEVTISDVWQPPDATCSTEVGFATQMSLYCHIDPATGARWEVYVSFSCSGTQLYLGLDAYEGSGSTVRTPGEEHWHEWVVSTPALASRTFVIRFEVEASGTGRAYVNGDLKFTALYTAPSSGNYVGVYNHWYVHEHEGPTTAHAPRILSVSGGCLEPLECDDFERANGALGPAWLAPAPAGWGRNSTGLTAAPLVIIDGAATNVTSSYFSSMAGPSAASSIEVVIERAFDSTTPTNTGYITLMTNMAAGSFEARAIDFDFTATNNIDITLFRFDAAGAWTSVRPGTIHWGHDGESEPLMLRMESNGDVVGVWVDGVFVVEFTYPSLAAGLVGAEVYATSGKNPIRILSACIDLEGG